jgi:hypothetical protein
MSSVPFLPHVSYAYGNNFPVIMQLAIGFYNELYTHCNFSFINLFMTQHQGLHYAVAVLIARCIRLESKA